MRKNLLFFGVFTILGLTLLGGRASRHEDNPIDRPVGTVGPNDFYYPDIRTKERVELVGLSMERYGGIREALGSAKCIARYLATNSPTDPKKMGEWLSPKWDVANGAKLYQTYIFALVKPLSGGHFFNNNPDASVDKQAWSWVRYDSVTNVTICYTSRGMVLTPGMPTRNMKAVDATGKVVAY